MGLEFYFPELKLLPLKRYVCWEYVENVNEENCIIQESTQSGILHKLFEILSVQDICLFFYTCLIIISFIYNNMDSKISIMSLGLWLSTTLFYFSGCPNLGHRELSRLALRHFDISFINVIFFRSTLLLSSSIRCPTLMFSISQNKTFSQTL